MLGSATEWLHLIVGSSFMQPFYRKKKRKKKKTLPWDHPTRVVEQGNLAYHVIVVTASHDINVDNSIENIRVSSIMKLTMW